MLKPVSAPAAGAVENNRFNVADGDAVLLATGSACQWNTWLEAVCELLLKVEATRPNGLESAPPAAVAVAAAGKFNRPRMVAPPLTSRVAAGVMVPIPIFAVLPVPDCNKTELPSALELV